MKKCKSRRRVLMKEGKQQAKQKFTVLGCVLLLLTRSLPPATTPPRFLVLVLPSDRRAKEGSSRARHFSTHRRLHLLLLAARGPRSFFLFFSSRYGFLFVCFSLLDLIITVLFLFIFLSYKLTGSRLRFWCVSGCLCSKIFGYS